MVVCDVVLDKTYLSCKKITHTKAKHHKKVSRLTLRNSKNNHNLIVKYERNKIFISKHIL